MSPIRQEGDIGASARVRGTAVRCTVPKCSPGESNSDLHVFSVTCDRYTRAADRLPRQESNLQLRRSERRLRSDTECSAMAVPRGAAPLPPVRQTGVQICYTMAPWDQDAGRSTQDSGGGVPLPCLHIGRDSSDVANPADGGRRPLCRGTGYSSEDGPPRSRASLRGFGDRPGRSTAALERLAGIAPASPVWKTGALLLS